MSIETITEIVDRVRRIETRLTRYMIRQGFETQAQKTRYDDGVLYAPSRHTALADILAALPTGPLPDRVPVMVKTDQLCTIYTPDIGRVA